MLRPQPIYVALQHTSSIVAPLPSLSASVYNERVNAQLFIICACLFVYTQKKYVSYKKTQKMLC